MDPVLILGEHLTRLSMGLTVHRQELRTEFYLKGTTGSM